MTLSPDSTTETCANIWRSDRPAVLKLYLRSILLWSIENCLSVHRLLLCFYSRIETDKLNVYLIHHKSWVFGQEVSFKLYISVPSATPHLSPSGYQTARGFLLDVI